MSPRRSTVLGLSPGRPAGGGETRVNRVYLPGLRRARLDAGLSSRRLAALVAEARVRGARGPSIGKTTLQDWELLLTSAPEWVVPFLATAIGCSGKKLTEAA